MYLLGAGYCERCKQLCSVKRRKRTSTTTTTRKAKPAHLKYVQYYPGTVVTPGWDGVDRPTTVPRIPAYWTYARAVANRDARRGDITPLVPSNQTIAAMPVVSRKRKIMD